VVVSAGNLVCSLTAVWTIDIGGLSTVLIGNFPQKGRFESLNLYNLGSLEITSRTRFLGTSSEYTTWISSSSVTAKCAAGVGRTKAPFITAGLSVSSLSQAITYDAPEMSELYSCVIDRSCKNVTSLLNITDEQAASAGISRNTFIFIFIDFPMLVDNQKVQNL
jgi:hypothetical protein